MTNLKVEIKKPNCSGIIIMNTVNYEELFNHHVTWSKQ